MLRLELEAQASRLWWMVGLITVIIYRHFCLTIREERQDIRGSKRSKRAKGELRLRARGAGVKGGRARKRYRREQEKWAEDELRSHPARLGFRGMDPWVKPEDDSADKGALLTTEAVEPSVTGSEIGAEKSRCLDRVCVKHDISLYVLCFCHSKKIIQHRMKSCASGSRRSLRDKMEVKVENWVAQLNVANFV